MTRLARLRRPLASLFAAAAAGLALLALRPGPPPSVPVLAAARDLPAGKRLTPSDLHQVSLPPAAAPSGALSKATGRVLAGPMRQGEPLTDARVLGEPLLHGYGPGTVATPVRIADPAAVHLLHPGDHIDVLATPTNAPPPFPPPEGASTTTTQNTPPKPQQPQRTRRTLDHPVAGAAALRTKTASIHHAPAIQIRHAPADPAARPTEINVPDVGLGGWGGTGWGDARVVVSGVPVVAVPPADEGSGQQGALVVLATDRTQALALAAAGPLLSLTITGH